MTKWPRRTLSVEFCAQTPPKAAKLTEENVPKPKRDRIRPARDFQSLSDAGKFDSLKVDLLWLGILESVGHGAPLYSTD